MSAPSAQQLWFLDTLVTIRLPGSAGPDGITVMEHHAPHGDSPPLHIHRREDEVFHVLDGVLRLRSGDDDMRLEAGSTFLAAQGNAHTYRVESAGGARWLTITRGGDFERFVRALGRPAQRAELPPPSGPPTPEAASALADVARQHGVDLVGPPLS
ncbi:cupin domain-containing protein [Deinococcus aerophilus]|nr:cupin domain-containing protein [Deinococcus aerophilus]